MYLLTVVAPLLIVVSATARAPEHLIVIMEGESLFNDATSIVLFQIFFHAVQNINNKKPAFEGSTLRQMMTVSQKIVTLALGMMASASLQHYHAQVSVGAAIQYFCLVAPI